MTDMTTASLTDFLLARIAEDEAAAPGFHRLLCMRTACDADNCIWGEDEQELMEQERVCTCDYPARVLAECAAKRRIVWLYQATEEPALYDAVMALADIYTDHPDYREEWRRGYYLADRP